MNRETWLEKAVTEITPIITAVGYAVPEVRVSCGWPATKALAKKSRRVGECWAAEAATDKRAQIYISPVIEEGVKVLDILVHEMGHAVLGKGVGHKGPFREFMRKVGLTGKPTSTIAGPGLLAHLQEIEKGLGPYPHSSIDKLEGPTKKQSTRMRKIICDGGDGADEHDEYILRGAKATLEAGIPDCPLCGREMSVEEPDEGEGT